MGLILAGTVFAVVQRMSSSALWRDSHRLAIIVGGITDSMVAGFWASGITLAIDFIGKGIFDAVTVVLPAYVAGKIRDGSYDDCDGLS
jgi:hypothetical protein